MIAKSPFRFLSFVVLSAALCACSPVAYAQTTNDAPAKASEPKSEKKKSGGNRQQGLPFKGQLKALDKSAKTITVGERTFQITSSTRIFKDGKPALLESGVVGEPITGSYKQAPDGKLNAASVYFGGRPTAKAAEKKADAQ